MNELIGIKVKRMLKIENMTIAELSRRTGLNRTTINDNLNNKTTMGVETLVKIARCLNVSIEWLIR